MVLQHDYCASTDYGGTKGRGGTFSKEVVHQVGLGANNNLLRTVFPDPASKMKSWYPPRRGELIKAVTSIGRLIQRVGRVSKGRGVWI